MTEIHVLGVTIDDAQHAIEEHGQPVCDCGREASFAVFMRDPRFDAPGLLGIGSYAACDLHDADMRKVVQNWGPPVDEVRVG